MGPPPCDALYVSRRAKSINVAQSLTSSSMAREGASAQAPQANGSGGPVRNRSAYNNNRNGTNNGDVELQNTLSTLDGNTHTGATPPPSAVPLSQEHGFKRFIRRFRGEGRHVPSWSYSFVALATCSSTPHVLHVMIVVI